MVPAILWKMTHILRATLRYGRWIFLLLTLLLLLSCNSDDDSDTGLWSACPDYSRLDENAECAWVSAPLDYEKPDAESIDLFVYRYRGSSQEKKGQVWLFEGGPGGSGVLLANTLRYQLFLNTSTRLPLR